MKVSEQWLRELVNPNINTETLGKQLTSVGLEIESITPAGLALDNVVIGEIISITKHPEADKLHICQVNIGGKEPLQIVCGAKEVKVGMKVPAALVGAQLTKGLVIKASKIRGVDSFGMLCAEEELGIAEKSDNLMILPQDASVGQSIAEYMHLDDHIFEIGLTPNRGDCASIMGIAREIGVLNKLTVNEVVVEKIKITHTDKIVVDVLEPKLCPNYCARIIKNVNLKAQTPIWIQERLRRCGVRSINPIVDVTNYVMLELGQPTHAFDLDQLNTKIVVRTAKNGEDIALLNGQNIKLRSDTLVIADSEHAHAIAGVMGDLPSSVTNSTQNIVLESALFSVEYIAPVARSYGLHTDSSYRFERGVCPQLQEKALERASKLILEICGGDAGPIVAINNNQSKKSVISLHKVNIKRLLGFTIADEIVIDILERLGAMVSKNGEKFDVSAPCYRYDLNIEADLIEELVRIVGYDKVQAVKIQSALDVKPLPNKVTLARVKRLLVDREYNEAITYSFIEPKLQQMFSPTIAPLVLANPISSEMSVMRTNLWPGLILATQYNNARQQDRVRLFETGLRFIPTDTSLEQEAVIAILAQGAKQVENWQEKVLPIDFYAFKADLMSLLQLSYQETELQFIPHKNNVLHPAQCAKILANGKELGIMGALHPRIEQELKLVGPIYLAEFRLDQLLVEKLYQFKAVSKFPSVRRDLAFIIDENILVGDMVSFIKQEGGDLLHSVTVFDVYYGDNISKGCKSMALGLVLQHGSYTLTDDNVDAFIKEVSTKLGHKFNATLRD